MNTVVLLLISVSLQAPSPKPDRAPAKRVDHSDPVSVTTAVFRAAATAETKDLKGLCDPDGKNDGDTKAVCRMTTTSKDWPDFVKYFAKAAVSGPARIQGNKAEVPFLFGPRGTKKETMVLVRRGSGWYLSSF